MKNREVVERILAYHPAIPDSHGNDGWKWGDPEAECTGVAVALTAAVGVIRRAAEIGANLLIVHEPTFYTSRDPDGWREDFPNAVFQEKRDLLDRHGIAIWRDHDHMHAHRPDAIFTGVLACLGWEDYTAMPCGPYTHYLIRVPETTLGALMEHLTAAIGMNGLRYIGDPGQRVRTVALVGHLYTAFTGELRSDGQQMEYGVQCIRLLEQGADVLLPGEVIDWTVVSYIRDAVQLGHFNWEELGMRYAREWIGGLLGGGTPVTYLPSGDLYSFFPHDRSSAR